MQFISFNSQIIDKKLLNFYLVERFRVADACFESILFLEGKFPLMNFHRERIYKSCKILGLQNYEVNSANLLDLIARNNGLTKNLKIRISIVRAEGSNYTPIGNQVAVLIECFEIKRLFNPVQTLGNYTLARKEPNFFSKIKTANALIYVLAKQFAIEKEWKDVLIQNTSNHWIEATSSNLFLVKNEIIYSPKENSGCVLGIFRQFLSNFLDIKFVDIKEDLINEADEIFLTNAVNLIQPVLSYNNRALETKYTNQLILKTKKKLNISATY